jgi:hypothetical protein
LAVYDITRLARQQKMVPDVQSDIRIPDKAELVSGDAMQTFGLRGPSTLHVLYASLWTSSSLLFFL